MAEAPAKQRSAVVFGARNLGRAVIELLVGDGWAVAGVARSRSTLDGVSASGALAVDVEARITAARELGQEAEASGVLVCVENDGTAAPTDEAVARLLERVNHPAVRG